MSKHLVCPPEIRRRTGALIVQANAACADEGIALVAEVRFVPLRMIYRVREQRELAAQFVVSKLGMLKKSMNHQTFPPAYSETNRL